MANANGSQPRMDIQTLYPNFHAEQHKHHVQAGRVGLSTSRKRRDGGSNARNRHHSSSSASNYAVGVRPVSRSGLGQPKQHAGAHNVQSSLLPSARDGIRPPRADRRTVPPLTASQSSNQLDETPRFDRAQDAAPTATAALMRPPSRQIAIRGELSISAPSAWDGGDLPPSGLSGASPLLQPLALPQMSTVLGDTSTPRSVASTDDASLQELVFNARPRSRYARRELQRQGSARALARISTAPATLLGVQSLDGDASAVGRHVPSVSLLTGIRPSTESTTERGGAGGIAECSARSPSSRHAFHPEPDDDDEEEVEDPSFFLTELEAEAQALAARTAARRKKLAGHIARGSFLLYGSPPAFTTAIRHFQDALEMVEPSATQAEAATVSSEDLSLAALLHHHRGVALRELVVSTSSSSTERTKQAFAAQRRALELAQQTNDLRLQARAVKALGVLLLDAHAHGPALAHQQEALALALEVKDRELEARVYANLGNLALARLQFGHALSCHERDLALCAPRAADSTLGRARAHRNLALVFTRLQRHSQRVTHEREANRAEAPNGGAFLQDLVHHARDSVGNICLQLSVPLDEALVELVAQHLDEIVGEHEQLQSTERRTETGMPSQQPEACLKTPSIEESATSVEITQFVGLESDLEPKPSVSITTASETVIAPVPVVGERDPEPKQSQDAVQDQYQPSEPIGMLEVDPRARTPDPQSSRRHSALSKQPRPIPSQPLTATQKPSRRASAVENARAQARQKAEALAMLTARGEAVLMPSSEISGGPRRLSIRINNYRSTSLS